MNKYAPVGTAPDQVKKLFYNLRDISSFTGRFFKKSVGRAPDINELLAQCYSVGYQSLFLVGLTAIIIWRSVLYCFE